MKKVLIETATPVIENGRIAYSTARNVYVVASTKSLNNLIDDLNEQNLNPKTRETSDLYLDKSITEKAVAATVIEQLGDNEISAAVVAHTLKALDTACLFFKPIIRKK